MDTKEVKKQSKFTSFNNVLADIFHNIFRLFFTVFKFAIKLGALLLITFPFVIIVLAFANAEYAISTLNVITQFLQKIVDIFKQIKG